MTASIQQDTYPSAGIPPAGEAHPTDTEPAFYNEPLQSLWGTAFSDLMNREDITEIYVNDDGFIRYKSHVEGKVKSSLYFDPELIGTIIKLIAGQAGKICDETIPSISTEIKGYGARFQGELPTIVRNPQFNIRKKALKIFTLDDYVRDGNLPPSYKTIIEEAIAKRKNILISGGTDTGKTTFLNAILEAISRISPLHRIISLEDLPELQCPSDDYSPMYTMQETGKNGMEYNMTRLLKDCMRRSPDRIIVGEVRDGSGYTLLKAWNTGHPGGVSTTHADDAVGALTRIHSLALENPEAGNANIYALIAEAIDMVINITKADIGGGKLRRYVNDIALVKGFDKQTETFILEHISP